MGGASGAVIRSLAADDLREAFALSSTAGWNQRLDDWRMLRGIAPAGSFAAFSEGRLVGTAIGIDYGSFSWIAMMLVDPACRGRGLGRRLLEAAMGAVPQDRAIRLDATPMGRPLYQAYGFEDEAMLTRYVADPSGLRAPDALDPSAGVRPLTPGSLATVAGHDRQVFGGDRRAVLEWALDGAPGYGHVALSETGLPQYCFGRQGRLFDQIGPVVAGADSAARALVSAALRSAAGRAVVIDAYDASVEFTAWLRACGLEAQRPLYRMRRLPDGAGPPGQGGKPAPLGEFAILGPEFA